MITSQPARHEVKTLGVNQPPILVSRRPHRIILEIGDSEVRLSTEQAERLAAAIQLENDRGQRDLNPVRRVPLKATP